MIIESITHETIHHDPSSYDAVRVTVTGTGPFRDADVNRKAAAYARKLGRVARITSGASLSPDRFEFRYVYHVRPREES